MEFTFREKNELKILVQLEIKRLKEGLSIYEKSMSRLPHIYSEEDIKNRLQLTNNDIKLNESILKKLEEEY